MNFHSLTVVDVVALFTFIVSIWQIHVRTRKAVSDMHADNIRRIDSIEKDVRLMFEWFKRFVINRDRSTGGGNPPEDDFDERNNWPPSFRPR